MITLALIIQNAPYIWLGIGAVGSLIEKIGINTNNQKLIEIGKTMESISVDLPKFLERFKGLIPSGNK